MSRGARPRSIWNSCCDSILLDALFAERSQGRQTDNAGWHASAWTAAETLLAGTEVRFGGVKKNSTSCQNRWTTVSNFILFVKLVLIFWTAQKGVQGGQASP